MMAIILNCFTLGMYHPCGDEVCISMRCQLLELFDDFIFVFFALEMLIKMIAMGVRGSKSAYLSDSWNRLDAFIVFAGAFEYIMDIGDINLTAVRTVRVLRPLRAINRIPSMRILVMLLLDTLPMLGNVLLLCFFVFFIFGIIGVQLWAGLLRQRCYLKLPDNFTLPASVAMQLNTSVRLDPREDPPVIPSLPPYYYDHLLEKDYICSIEKDHGIHRCNDLPPFRIGDVDCSLPISSSSNVNNLQDVFNGTHCINWNAYYSQCKPGPKNPFQGAISFDNVGMAWTAIFVVISLEGWTEIMYYVQDAHSFWDWLYFVLLIVIGSFLMINLCLVVIATQFSETKKRELERMRQERERFADSTSTLGSLQSSEATDCYNAIIKYIAHLVRRGKRKLWRWYLNHRKLRKVKGKVERRKKKKQHPQQYEEQGGNDNTHLAIAAAGGSSTFGGPGPSSSSFNEEGKRVKREQLDHTNNTQVDLTGDATSTSHHSSSSPPPPTLQQHQQQQQLSPQPPPSASASALHPHPQVHPHAHPVHGAASSSSSSSFALKLQQPPTGRRPLSESSESKGKPVRLAIFLYPADSNLEKDESIRAPVASPEKSDVGDLGESTSLLDQDASPVYPPCVSSSASNIPRKSNLKPCLTIDTTAPGAHHHPHPHCHHHHHSPHQQHPHCHHHHQPQHCHSSHQQHHQSSVVNGSCLKAASTTPTPRSPKQLNFAPGPLLPVSSVLPGAPSSSLTTSSQRHCSAPNVMMVTKMTKSPSSCLLSPPEQQETSHQQQTSSSSSHHQTHAHANATRSVSNPCPSSDQVRSIHRKSSSHRTDSCSDTSLAFDWTYDSYEDEEEMKNRERRGSNRSKALIAELETGQGDLTHCHINSHQLEQIEHQEDQLEQQHRRSSHQISNLPHSPKEEQIAIEGLGGGGGEGGPRGVGQVLVTSSTRTTTATATTTATTVTSCLECHRSGACENKCASKGKRKRTDKAQGEVHRHKHQGEDATFGALGVIASSIEAASASPVVGVGDAVASSSPYSEPGVAGGGGDEDAVHFVKDGPSACYSTGKKGNKHPCHSSRSERRKRKNRTRPGCHYSSNESISCSLSSEDEDGEEEEEDDDEDEDDQSDSSSIDEWHSSEGCIKCYNGWVKVTSSLKILVDHKYFKRFIFLSILINALAMGIEYHNQPEELTVAVEISNMVFTFVFAFEMILKLLADGCYKYLTDGFNLFDGIVVFVSLMEFMADEEGSGLSVLRTFRLLRILKLVRFMPALKRQLVIMIRTMDNVAVFFALLVLFIFIFSCLGMHLFGGKFCTRTDGSREACSCEDLLRSASRTASSPSSIGTDLAQSFGSLVSSDSSSQLLEQPFCKCDRKHFNNFLWATITVFQVLTQEDWNVVLFNAMDKTNHWSAIYFVVLMTFGNYVLFNLLVAILVEGFSTQEDYNCKESECESSQEVRDEKLIYFYDAKDDLEQAVSMASPISTGAPVKLTPQLNRESTRRRGGPGGGGGGGERGERSLVHATVSVYEMDSHSHGGASETTSVSTTRRDSHSGHSEWRQSLKKRTLGSKQLSLPAKRPSLVHEANRMNARTSLSGIFYCTSVTRKDSSATAASGVGPVSPLASTAHKSPQTNGLTIDTSNRNFSHNSATSHTFFTSQQQTTTSTTTATATTSTQQQQQQQLLVLQQLQQQKHPSQSQSQSQLQQQQQQHQQSHHHQQHPHQLGHPHQHHSRGHSSLPQQQRCRRYQQQRSQSLFHHRHCYQSNQDNDFDALIGRESRGPSRAGDEVECQTFQVTTSTSEEDGRGKSSVTTKGNSFIPQGTGSEGNKGMVKGGQVTCCSSLQCPPPPHSPLPQSGPLHPHPHLHPPSVQIGGETSDPTAGGCEMKKFCKYFKWTSWMEERTEYSLFLFPPGNAMREIFTLLIEHKYFDYFILVFISLNCITLAMERPKIWPGSLERELLSAANYVFTVIFAAEMAMKVIACGLVYGPRAYFKSGWNTMDGILVGVSLLDLFLSFIAQKSPRIFGILRVFRLLRSLRPLRVINRAPGLKLVVQTLLSSLRPIGNIVLICCTFFIIFGILGVQLFKGAFYYCEGVDVRNVKNRTDCLKNPNNRWVNKRFNFDNLGQALMALFVLSSKDGWVNIMYQGLDAVGVDQQPIENYNEWRLLFFISFLLLVAFFVLNMFVGVVVENFHRCRAEQEKEERARRAEKRARKLENRRRRMRETPYFLGYGPFRLSIHRLVANKYFDVVIAAVIGLNVITMSLEYYEMPVELVYGLKLFNFVFTGVFTCELLMKLYALGISRYMSERWNQLDVLIVILSIVGILLEEIESNLIPINPTIIRVMRVARIARVLKLLKMAKGMRALLNTVAQALPQVGNLGLLFFLLFYIFAALGVELFGRLECDEEHPCQGMSEHAHFQNFGMAFLTLFRVATGDNWSGLMKDTLRDQCDANPDCISNCCTNHIIAPLYFVIFVLLAQFVLVNVVVAVLMKHLEESHRYVDEDEDFEIDLEIARELQAEQKALEEAAERRQRKLELTQGRSFKEKLRLTKVSSLPANITFHFQDEEDLQSSSPFVDLHSDHGRDCRGRKKHKPLITIDPISGSPVLETVAPEDDFNNCLSPKEGSNRKFSDITIVDEESANLSQYLIPNYPELMSIRKNSQQISWIGEKDGDSMSSISTDNSLAAADTEPMPFEAVIPPSDNNLANYECSVELVEVKSTDPPANSTSNSNSNNNNNSNINNNNNNLHPQHPPQPQQQLQQLQIQQPQETQPQSSHETTATTTTTTTTRPPLQKQHSSWSLT